MRYVNVCTSLSVAVLILAVGCAAPSKSSSVPSITKTTPTEPAAYQRAASAGFTAENNPTSRSGRGEPDLGDSFRPAAWVYVDGKAGTFIEKDGNPQVQWVIDEPVGSTPTFRVEAYEPLLGNPKGFRCVVQTITPVSGPAVAYTVRADEGTFEVGREYSLVQPGEGFAMRNQMTGDVVTEIPPLIPGTYLMAAGVRNEETGKDALAVTYFTVRGDD